MCFLALKLQDAAFAVLELGDRGDPLDGQPVDHGVDLAIDFPMPHDEQRLPLVAAVHLVEEALGPPVELELRLGVGGALEKAEVDDGLARQAAPVDFSEERRGLEGDVAIAAEDLGRPPCPLEVAADDPVEGGRLQLFREAPGLGEALVCQLAGQVALENAGEVLFRLPVADQIECCLASFHDRGKIKRNNRLGEGGAGPFFVSGGLSNFSPGRLELGLGRRTFRRAVRSSFWAVELFAGPSGARFGLSNFSPGRPELVLGCRTFRRAVRSPIWAVELFAKLFYSPKRKSAKMGRWSLKPPS